MKKKTRGRIVAALWCIVFIPVAILLIFIACVGIFAEIPSFEELENPKSYLATELISEDGKVLSTYHIENRTHVGYRDLAPSLVDAAIATEDIRFYSHSGIDFRSLVRVGVKSILLGHTRSGGGGSTITQQLAKTLFPRDTEGGKFPGQAQFKLVVSKFKEWITAVKLERNYTKDEIMAMYMNAIFFGSNAYGIQAASNTYFGKEPWELKTEESAVLVGVVNKPTRFNPVLNYDLSIERRNHVLNQMCKYGFLSRAEADSLISLPIILNYKEKDHNSGQAPYFRDMLRKYMTAGIPDRDDYTFKEDFIADSTLWEEDPLYGWIHKNLKPDGSEYSLDKDGLKIYTTINSRMQRYAEEAIDEHLGKNLQPALFSELRGNPNRPFAREVPSELSETLMAQARKWSDRYRNMKSAGASEKEIREAFGRKVRMRVFAWNENRYADTTMTPDDSIRYYKSLLRSAFIAMEPSTGHVKAYVGGPDYRYFKYDNARQGKRQVGSTIKPFLYTLAMQEGYYPCDRVLNVPQTFVLADTTWTPKSEDRAEWIGKSVTLKWGLTRSSNNISAYLIKQFGPEAMVEMCRKLGITSYLAPYPSLCLGPADITLLEMVGAYNTYPSRGVHVEPMFVTRIEDKEGNVLGIFTPRKREAVSEATAYLMVNLLQGVVNEGTAGRLRFRYNLPGQIAGKTGTTNDKSDGWFMGFTPTLTAGLWVGAEDRQVHFDSMAMGQGANTALPIWGLFMQKVYADGTLGVSPDDRFIVPPGISFNTDCDGSDNDATVEELRDAEDSFFNF
ncbi:MAG TPA: transglycosylase domain-containing protein [Candidatus Coprenecus stercoripullorum]|nr:transglycosylase domain-containing protein [Candidatus Coprenecus stercoripullorum]